MSKQESGRYHAPEGSLRAAFEALPDVRRGQGRVHSLGGMLALAVCALLCGCRSLYAIAQWGQDCGPEIRAALGLRRERGPSVPTLHRAFRQLDHPAFEQVLSAWFAAQGLQAEEAIAIDGKTLCGIHGEQIPRVHLVAAFARAAPAWCWGRARPVAKGMNWWGVNAVLADLPARLLSGRVVTGDALLASRDLCRRILAKGGTISSS